MPFHSYQAAQIRARKGQYFPMQAARLKQQQEQQDPWLTSPINILNMPLSSTQLSRAPSTRLSHPARAAAKTSSAVLLKQAFSTHNRKPPRSQEPTEAPLFSDERANQQARRLGFSNAPERWQGGNGGWILWTIYQPVIDWQTNFSTRVKSVDIEQLPVRISTLAPSEQCIAYRRLLKAATPAQVAAYYKLFCNRLDEARCSFAGAKLGHWKERRRIEHARLKSFCREKAILKILDKVQDMPLSDMEKILEKKSREIVSHRVFARGLEQLIEGCETLLQLQQKEGEAFTPIDWRAFTSRKRWRDGERGWTGLSEEDVGCGVVEVRSKRNVRFNFTAMKAVLRARFARCFPRAVDKRVGAVDGETDT